MITSRFIGTITYLCFGGNRHTLNAKRIGFRHLTVIYTDFTGAISEQGGMADLWEMMPMKLLSFGWMGFREGRGVSGRILAGVAVAFVMAVSVWADAPASHEKSQRTAPTANASKLQAWKDAEAIAALAPGRTEVIGAGESMMPVYGENTILVISKIGYDELKPGMNVVYMNRRAKLVVHQTIARERKGWRVQGINNDRADAERVTRENLVGVVYASLSYSDEDGKKPTEAGMKGEGSK